MQEKQVKLISIKEAVSRVPNGASITMCGSFIRRNPMAFVHELIRQDKKELTLYGWNNGMDYDMLIGAGCIKESHSSYVGIGNLGLAKNFRRACEQGKVRHVDHSETTAMDRFFAGYQGHTFIISKTPLNSGLQIQPEYQTEITCPFTGEVYCAMQAWTPEFCFMHAARADKYGNVQLDTKRTSDNDTDLILAKASKRVFVSVEEIVDEEFIIENMLETVLSRVFVEGVCLAPFGAHPNSCDTRYFFDLEFGRFYQECSQTEEGFKKFINDYVHNVKDWDEYLDKVGRKHLKVDVANSKF